MHSWERKPANVKLKRLPLFRGMVLHFIVHRTNYIKSSFVLRCIEVAFFALRSEMNEKDKAKLRRTTISVVSLSFYSN